MLPTRWRRSTTSPSPTPCGTSEGRTGGHGAGAGPGAGGPAGAVSSDAGIGRPVVVGRGVGAHGVPDAEPGDGGAGEKDPGSTAGEGLEVFEHTSDSPVVDVGGQASAA